MGSVGRSDKNPCDVSASPPFPSVLQSGRECPAFSLSAERSSSSDERAPAEQTGEHNAASAKRPPGVTGVPGEAQEAVW